MNAYFRLQLKNEGTFLEIFRETDDGLPLNINEVSDYLSKKGIFLDIVVLNRKINALEGDGAVKVDAVKRLPESEMMVFKISDDKMQAVCRFYPPSNNGNMMTAKDIVSELNFNGIKYGIDNDAIKGFIESKKYCTDYIFAVGKQVRNGRDAYIDYNFKTDLSTKPALKEDGSVDFFNLDLMNNISEGDLLATLHPEDLGESGIDVLNEVVKPREVKHLKLSHGHNVRLSADGLKAFSEVSGHVMLVNGDIFVSNVYEVANVDASTGDIRYDGSVKVLGNINSNFTVRAKGNIEVNGVVEGATLVADGSIIVARGINGMGKGYIRAKGNIITKYVENATLISGGYIQSEAIMHSKVSAKTEVNVDGRKGNIAASYVSAGESVTAKTLGSTMGTDTVIQLGIDPEMKIRLDEIKEEYNKANKNLAQLIPVVDALKKKAQQGISMNPDQVEALNKLSAESVRLLETREDYLYEMDDIKDSLARETRSSASVKDIVYSGTKICINDISMTLKTDYKYCRFYKENGDIHISSL